MIWLLLACHKPLAESPIEPLPTDLHSQAEAEARQWLPDPQRGGPALQPGQSPLPPFRGVDRSSATYTGSEACQGCHPAAFDVWATSRHAHALEPLQQAQRDHDPNCIPCHFTGFQHPGGKMETSMAKVGCESCHGPASDHLKSPTPGYGELPSSGAACVACHSHDNSPDFRWETYWPQIAHP